MKRSGATAGIAVDALGSVEQARERESESKKQWRRGRRLRRENADKGQKDGAASWKLLLPQWLQSKPNTKASPANVASVPPAQAARQRQTWRSLRRKRAEPFETLNAAKTRRGEGYPASLLTFAFPGSLGNERGRARRRVKNGRSEQTLREPSPENLE